MDDTLSESENKQDAATPIDVEAYLGGVDYPAERDDLIAHAQAVGAPQDVLEELAELPDMEYATPADVSRELAALTSDADVEEELDEEVI